MGTSQSKPGTPGGSPLVPKWADQDPTPPGSEPEAPDGQDDGAQPAPPPAVPAPGPILPPSPFGPMKRALRDYLRTGDLGHGRQALARYARAVGGGGGSARHARAARSGAGAISALAAAARAAGNPGAIDGFDLSALTGRPLEDAIGAIVDRFCPPGILDEDVIRAAVSDSLFEALGDVETFDPANITDRVVVVATACFVAEIVFASMAAEQGASANDVSPDVAVRRENDLRDLVREVADQIATPIIQREGGALNADRLSGIILEITSAVEGEIAQW